MTENVNLSFWLSISVGLCCVVLCYSYVDSGKRACQNVTDIRYVSPHQIHKNYRKSTFLGAFDSEKTHLSQDIFVFTLSPTSQNLQNHSGFFI